MVKNYYKVLNIPTTATLDEVNAGFKRALLKYHPKKTRLPLAQAARELLEAYEAYEVLSTSDLRSVYDAYGFDVLEAGIQKDGETIFPAYKFRSSPEELYKKFMLEANPFAFLANNVGSQCIGAISGYSESGKNWEIDLTPPNVEVDVECSLEELFFGCSKKVKFVKISRQELSSERGKVSVVKDVLIKPGFGSHTSLVYKGEGNEKVNGEKGDLIIKVKEKPHVKFSRTGNDLNVTVSLGLHEALNPEVILVENIDKSVKCVSVDHCISPQHVSTIKGEGMPLEDSSHRGDLHVHFSIIFPERIPEDRLPELKTLLPN
jgi:DnaJ-class molecular chaperone